MPATARKEEGDAQVEETAPKKSTMMSPRDPELPPLQEWIDQQYKDLKKEFHETREKIIESEPDREPYMPYCFNSLLAYTNTDVPQYCLYKRYEENPSAYCQRRTAIRLTEPEVSWAMDNVLFLSDYEMYYKPLVPMGEEEEQAEEEEEEVEGEGEGEKEKKQKTVKKGKKSTQKKQLDKQKPKQSKPKETKEGAEEDESEEQEQQQEEEKPKPEDKKEEPRNDREEQDYRKAKEIWIASSFDYIFDKPEKTQNSLLAALRQNRRFLKDIKKSTWERLINDRREAFKKMVQWKKEQEDILRKRKPANKSEQEKGEEEGEGKEEEHEQKGAEQEQEAEN